MEESTIGRPMEILLIEDSLSSARLTIGALKKSEIQHRLTWLIDGEDALEFLNRSKKYVHAPRPDLILLDLSLPKKDGRELLQEIKSQNSLKAIPVVVLTGSTSEKDQQQTEQLNVEGYLTKPVDIAKFSLLVKQLVKFWQEDMLHPPN